MKKMMKSKGMARGGSAKKKAKGMARGGRMKSKGMARGGKPMKSKGYKKGGAVTSLASIRAAAKKMGYKLVKMS